jgi:hypothetical protein
VRTRCLRKMLMVGVHGLLMCHDNMSAGLGLAEECNDHHDDAYD